MGFRNVSKNLKTHKMEEFFLISGDALTLIDSALDSFPTCLVSLFPFPTMVEKRMGFLEKEVAMAGNKEEVPIQLDGKPLYCVRRMEVWHNKHEKT